MYALSSERRKSTSFATSSDVPNRRIGTACSRRAFCSGVRTSSIGVSIGPGWTEFTRMLRGARSSAAAFVMPRNAHLVLP